MIHHFYVPSGTSEQLECDGHFGVGAPTTASLRLMADVVGNPKGLNPAFHQKYFGKLKPLDSEEFCNPLNPHYESRSVSYTGGCGPVPEDLSTRLSSYDFLPGIGQWIDDFGASAEHHFITAVDPTGSILNILIELIEVLEGNISILRHLHKKISGAIHIFQRMLSRGASLWLAWNFAIRPTISDLEHMVKSLERAMKRLKWLQKHNRKPTRVHYRNRRTISDILPLARRDPASQQTFASDEQAGTIWYCPSVLWANSHLGEFHLEYTAEVTLAATGIVSFDIPDEYLSDDGIGLGIVWSAIQGLYNPAAIVWEATPFSWLIDYFVAKREKLKMHSLKISPLPDAKLLASCWSIKVLLTGTVFYTDLYGQKLSVGHVTNSLYIRRLGLPEPSGSMFVLPFRWEQFGNVSAVLALLGLPSERWESDGFSFGHDIGVWTGPRL